MLAWGVNRDATKPRQALHPNFHSNVFARMKFCARSNAQKRIRAAQSVERVRLLPTDRSKTGCPKVTAQVMRSIAVVFHIARKRADYFRQEKLIAARKHHCEQSRSDKFQERDEG